MVFAISLGDGIYTRASRLRDRRTSMKKIFKILGILVVLVVLALVAIPYLFQDKIVSFVKDKANEELNATLDFSGYDLSIFSSFPDLTFNINDLHIDGTGVFDSTRLVSIKEAKIVLDLNSVIGGEEYEVKSIAVNELLLNAIVLEDVQPTTTS